MKKVIKIAVALILVIGIITAIKYALMLGELEVISQTSKIEAQKTQIDIELKRLEIEKLRLQEQITSRKTREYERQQEIENKLLQQQAKADDQQTKANAQQAQIDAQINAQKQLKEQEEKEAAFKAWYKPDPICNKIDNNWELLLKCTNDKLKKRKEFFSSTKSP